ncbi:THO complex subunit 7 homolog isoform X2 [Struthio camelus]|uniref:THO complex subunit 7 homolog isoform X2 n=1 Tax=Struthio camelus TaxID=8801 RepID=UPI003603EACB
MGAVTDDEVIRKRLLIDGDGAGDDRRINLLVKSFIKWCNSGSQEEGYSQYQRMLSTLSQCEFSMGKTLLVYDMNLREMENYEKIYKDIENSIAAAHEKISECKKQILQAKRIRKNRQEYDALAKVIQHHPDRHETLKHSPQGSSVPPQKKTTTTPSGLNCYGPSAQYTIAFQLGSLIFCKSGNKFMT